MFSNFKLPSFLQRMTSSSDENQHSCTGSSHQSQAYNHSMQKFYQDYAVLGEQNKLKTIFTKKLSSSLFNQNSPSQSQQEQRNYFSKAQLIYLKRKYPSLQYIDTSRDSYDHVAFKVIAMDKRQQQELQEKLARQMSYRQNVKKNPSCRNVQLPVGYFVEEVNSMCSKHTCVYVVFRRWQMGVFGRLSDVLVECLRRTGELSQKKIGSDSGRMQKNRPVSYKDSTTNASKHSSTINKINSPYNAVHQPPNIYAQSLVNQLNFDKVKSPISQPFSPSLELQSQLVKELLIMVRCVMKSLDFLKEEKDLPQDLNASDIIWSENNQDFPNKQSESQVAKHATSLKQQNKKIRTTITNRFQTSEQTLSLQTYHLTNPTIPKGSLIQMLTSPSALFFRTQDNLSQTFTQAFDNSLFTVNSMLVNSYYSPEQLNQQQEKSLSQNSKLSVDEAYNSLLFKLGMLVLDLWHFCIGVLEEMSNPIQNNPAKNNVPTVRDLVYSYGQDRDTHSGNKKPVIKIDWLKIAQLLAKVEETTGNAQKNQMKLFVMFKKVLKTLLSRSALERRSTINLVSSSDFIEAILLKQQLFKEPNQQKILYSTQNSHQQFSPFIQQPPIVQKQQIPKEPTTFFQYSNISQASQKPTAPSTLSFDPKSAYLKTINENPAQSNYTNIRPNQSLFTSPKKYQSFVPQMAVKPEKQSSYQPQGKQTIITQSISIAYQPTLYQSYQNQQGSQFSNQWNQSQYQPQSFYNLEDSTKFYTPTFSFLQDSVKKGYPDDSAKESPKLPTLLLPSFEQQTKPVTPPEITFDLERSSPIKNPQLHVQISTSDSEPPSYLPESSTQKIQTYHYEPPYKSSNQNILIEQDPNNTSEKKKSITEELFESTNGHQLSSQLIESANTNHLLQGTKTCQSIVQNPHSSQKLQPPSPQYVIEQYKGGGRYQGYVLNKKRHGYGKLFYHQGSHYEGEWFEDQMNGYGRLFYSTGQLAYEGHWQKDEFHGSGKVYNDNPTMLDDSFDYTNFNNLEEQWVHYEGELQHDLKEGHGVIMLENGESFEGEFHNDRINGEGRFVNLEGETIRGRWKDNVMVEEYDE